MSTTVRPPNELEIRIKQMGEAPRTHVSSVWTDPELIPESSRHGRRGDGRP